MPSNKEDCKQFHSGSDNSAGARRRNRRSLAENLLAEIELVKQQNVSLQSQLANLLQILDCSRPDVLPMWSQWNPFLAWCSMSPVPGADVGAMSMEASLTKEQRIYETQNSKGHPACFQTQAWFVPKPELQTKSTQWEPLPGQCVAVGVQAPEFLSELTAKLAGTWWNDKAERVEVQGNAFRCDGEFEEFGQFEDTLKVFAWQLDPSTVSMDTALWRNGEKSTHWYRNESMSKLAGEWESSAGPFINVQGVSCCFDQDRSYSLLWKTVKSR